MALARLARRQHGVVSLTQLRALDLTPSGVRSRAARGHLHRIHRGVYAVGPARLTREGCWMAAVLAYGIGAALSHRSAGGHWAVRPDNRPVTDISVPRRPVRSRPGVTCPRPAEPHRRRRHHPRRHPLHHGRPHAARPRRHGRPARHRARDRPRRRAGPVRSPRDGRGARQGQRSPRCRRRAERARDLVRPRVDRDSEIEERFLRACDQGGLSRPFANRWLVLADREVKADFLWPAERLVVETDGRRVPLHAAGLRGRPPPRPEPRARRVPGGPLHLAPGRRRARGGGRHRPDPPRLASAAHGHRPRESWAVGCASASGAPRRPR